jgi:hypothetical protein
MSARRTRSRYPNIYYRETPRGRSYEISFYDVSGRRRWHRVEGYDDIEAARSALAEAQGKTRKGERVAPAGVRFADVSPATSPRLASPSSAPGLRRTTGPRSRTRSCPGSGG